jgi:hypothetical protein
MKNVQHSQTKNLKIAGIFVVICGIFLICLASLVYFTQNSEIQVTAQVTGQTCHTQYNVALRYYEDRCDLRVQFKTVENQNIETGISNAISSEITPEPGGSSTVQLRYYKNDPSHPDLQTNYMSTAMFLGITGGGLFLIVGPFLMSYMIKHKIITY